MSNFLTKRNIIIGAIALVLIIALFFLISGPGKKENEVDGTHKKSGWGDFFGLGNNGDDQEGEPLSPKKILFSTAKEYRERAKWPPYTYPITAKNDPVKEDFENLPQEMPLNPDAKPQSGPYLVHYTPKNSFNTNEPLIIHAFMMDADRKKIPFEITATLTQGGAAGRQIAKMDMRDDGQPGDEKGDLIYTAAFVLPAEYQRADLPSNFVVILKAAAKGGEITVTNAFNVGNLNVKHTGKFSDRMESDEKGNHLVIEAEFNVEKEGFYHVQGSVYSEDGEAIGWAQNRIKLSAGTQKVPLKFYGNLFCSSKIDGPYVLRHFAYANVNAMPGPRSQNYKNLHTTAKYKAKDFTCVPFEDAEMLAKAKLLEQESAEEKQ